MLMGHQEWEGDGLGEVRAGQGRAEQRIEGGSITDNKAGEIRC